MVVDDGLLWQEIFSLREKLKIAVAAIKYYDPEFDDREFTHRLNSVDYDQLMEELSDEGAKNTEQANQPDKKGKYMDVREIVFRYGFTYAKITEMARKAELYCKKGGKYDFNDEQVLQIVRMCEQAAVKTAKVTTKDIAKMLNRSITAIQVAGNAIGITYVKAHPHDYTEDEISRIKARITEGERKAPEMTPIDPDWWIDPLPRCLQDDYEDD